MISLRLPLCRNDCLGKRPDPETSLKSSDWPRGDSNQWPCAPGEPLLHRFAARLLEVMWSLCVSTGNESLGWWVARMSYPPSLQLWNASIEGIATLTNLWQQMNGYREALKQQQGTEGDGRACSVLSLWNRWRGLIKFVFKLSGGRWSTVEREGSSVTQFYL